MNQSPDIIKLALRLLGLIAVLVLLLAGWLVYKQPDGVGGYLTGAFAVLQLVISRVGEAIRASKDMHDATDSALSDAGNDGEAIR